MESIYVCFSFPILSIIPMLACEYVSAVTVSVTLGYYESCPCGRAMEDNVHACVSREEQLKNSHTHTYTQVYAELPVTRSCCQGDQAWA